MRRLIFLFSFALVSCNYGLYTVRFDEESVESRSAAVKSLSAADSPNFAGSGSPGRFSFVVMTDVHMGNSRSDVPEGDFLDWFSAQVSAPDPGKRPVFAVSLGDNADGGHGDEYEKFREFGGKIAAAAQENGIPGFKLYSIMGNHDTYNNGWENFRKTVFPNTSAYCFSDGGFSFYFLDSGSGTLGESQRKALKEKMEADPCEKIVFTHYPIYAGGNFLMTMQDTMERNWILTLFRKNGVKQIFAGHAHKNYGFDYGGWREDVIASFTFSRYFALVTVDEDEGSVEFERIEF